MWIELLGLLGKLLCGQTCSACGQPDLACEKACVAPFPVVAVGDPTGSQSRLFPGRYLCVVYRLYTQMLQVSCWDKEGHKALPSGCSHQRPWLLPRQGCSVSVGPSLILVLTSGASWEAVTDAIAFLSAGSRACGTS